MHLIIYFQKAPLRYTLPFHLAFSSRPITLLILNSRDRELSPKAKGEEISVCKRKMIRGLLGNLGGGGGLPITDHTVRSVPEICLKIAYSSINETEGVCNQIPACMILWGIRWMIYSAWNHPALGG